MNAISVRGTICTMSRDRPERTDAKETLSQFMTVAMRKGYEHANFPNKCLSTDARHDAYETSMSNSTKKGLVALRNFRDFDSVSLGLQHLFESHLSKVIWCAFFDVFVLSYCYCRELLRNSAK